MACTMTGPQSFTRRGSGFLTASGLRRRAGVGLCLRGFFNAQFSIQIRKNRADFFLLALAGWSVNPSHSCLNGFPDSTRALPRNPTSGSMVSGKCSGFVPFCRNGRDSLQLPIHHRPHWLRGLRQKGQLQARPSGSQIWGGMPAGGRSGASGGGLRPAVAKAPLQREVQGAICGSASESAARCPYAQASIGGRGQELNQRKSK